MKKKIPFEDRKFFFQADLKYIKKAEAADGFTGGTIIEGYASTNDPDRHRDIVEPGAFKDSIKGDFKSNPIILFQHDRYKPIGKAIEMDIDDKGLFIKALIVDNNVEEKLQAGILTAFSIGYRPTKERFEDEDGKILDPKNQDDRERIYFDPTVIRVIEKLELLEISVVSIPANATALFSLAKSAEGYFNSKLDYLKSNYKDMPKKEESKPEVKEVEGAKADAVKAAEEQKEDSEKETKAVEAEEAKEETEETETDTETNTDETDGEGDADETDGEGEESEEEETEKSEVSAEEKALGITLEEKDITRENLVRAMSEIKRLGGLVEEMEAELNKIPVKQALAGGDVVEHSMKKEDDGEKDAKPKGSAGIGGISVKEFFDKEGSIST